MHQPATITQNGTTANCKEFSYSPPDGAIVVSIDGVEHARAVQESFTALVDKSLKGKAPASLRIGKHEFKIVIEDDTKADSFVNFTSPDSGEIADLLGLEVMD